MFWHASCVVDFVENFASDVQGCCETGMIGFARFVIGMFTPRKACE